MKLVQACSAYSKLSTLNPKAESFFWLMGGLTKGPLGMRFREVQGTLLRLKRGFWVLGFRA